MSYCDRIRELTKKNAPVALVDFEQARDSVFIPTELQVVYLKTEQIDDRFMSSQVFNKQNNSTLRICEHKNNNRNITSPFDVL